MSTRPAVPATRLNRRAALTGAIGTLLGGFPALAQVQWPPPNWSATKRLDHPLVGRIFNGSGVPAAIGQLLAAVRKADLVAIGEVHDNPDHHATQAVLARQRTGAAVFEHIPTDKAPALARWQAGRTADAGRDAAALLIALDWSHSGWPDAGMFEALFAAAISSGLKITPGDVPRARMSAIARQGEPAVAAAEKQRLGLDQQLPPVAADALLDELEASHCGLVPRDRFDGMAFAQRLRDATLADAMLAARETSGAAVLFAGNGHVRSDRGVAHYLEQRQPKATRLSVLQLEVEDGRLQPADYAAAGPADFVLFTPGVDRPDPCEGMRKAFQTRT